MAEIDLTELETIRRFSIATRGRTAPVEDVRAALQADLDALESIGEEATGQPASAADEPKATVPDKPAKKAAKKASKKASKKAAKKASGAATGKAAKKATKRAKKKSAD